MAKKKNKQIIRPWCWYCEREFEDEKVLMQHQKAKHFKCNMCPRRLNTAGGLAVHIQQVHKLEPENLPRIENALPGRDGYDVEIFGMEGIPAPDVADYKRRKEIELGLSAGSISQPQPKRPKVENRPLSEDELRAQLEAHKALMGVNSGPDPPTVPETNGGVVYGAPPQTYAAPPVPMIPPGVPPFMPGPMGIPGAMPPPFPPFAPMPAFPPGPPPGFVPPPGALPPGAPPFPPGARPPFPPGPFPPPGMAPPPSMTPTASSVPPLAPHPTFVPATQAQHQPILAQPSPPQPPPGSSHAPGQVKQLMLPNPALAQTNPELKKKTDLKHADANFSPEEHRAIHSRYAYTKPAEQPSAPQEETRGKKRARAEDFL